MANDKGWQRRSDEWVKAMHISRLQKEGRSKKRREDKEIQDKLLNKSVINPEKTL